AAAGPTQCRADTPVRYHARIALLAPVGSTWPGALEACRPRRIRRPPCCSDRDPQERVSLARFRRAPGSGSGDEPDRVSQALQENDVIDSRAVPEAAAPHR